MRLGFARLIQGDPRQPMSNGSNVNGLVHSPCDSQPVRAIAAGLQDTCLSSRSMPQTYALTRLPAASLSSGERTFIDHQPIDLLEAQRQHGAYRAALTVVGATVETLPSLPSHADSVFVEDTGVILPEVAVLARMGTASRLPEVDEMRNVLSRFRELLSVEAPATLEGGDVLVVGKTLLVGLSTRTNAQGVEMLQRLLRPFGYQVEGVEVKHCLHLKTACTALPDGRLLINPDWIDIRSLRDFSCIEVPTQEPWAACQLTLRDHVLIGQNNLATIELLGRQGFTVLPLELAEYSKAEAGPTCLSLVFTVA